VNGWVSSAISALVGVMVASLWAGIERRNRKLDRLADSVKWQAMSITLLCERVGVKPPELPESLLDL